MQCRVNILARWVNALSYKFSADGSIPPTNYRSNRWNLVSLFLFKGYLYSKKKIMRLIHIPILSIFNNHIIDYPTPINLSYFWGFGSLAGICLVIQITSGIMLAMHYTPHVDHAFNSVEHIMRDVNNGWLLRYVHANGASMFFAVIYSHIGRGIYYRSYKFPKQHLWFSGILIFILLMATAFIGYVLPWGQMSFWGATVITNLFTAIPLIGLDIAYWIWGGFSVDNATLNRFFSLHYLLPFLIVGLSAVHLVLLHLSGSGNPLGLDDFDKLGFYPYFYLKDLFGFLVFTWVFIYFVFFNPNFLGHPDNYIKANPLSTPTHIVPEWYFLPFYAILRTIPNKLGGVACMGIAIIILAILPFIDKADLHSPRFSFWSRIIFTIFALDVIFLGWLGGKPVEWPYDFLSGWATLIYFGYFGFIYFITNLEKLEQTKEEYWGFSIYWPWLY